MAAKDDPRRPQSVRTFQRDVVDPEPDFLQLASSGASMSGMWFKNRWLCVIGLFLALISFSRGTHRDFSYQQFIAAVAFSIMGLFTAAMAEIYPLPAAELAAVKARPSSV